MSLLSAGIGNSRTVTITPRDTQKTADVQTTAPIKTPPAEPAASETTPPANTSETKNSTTTYILNTNTKKFHLPDCASVTQMKEKNRRPFSGTREEAIAAGYSPCQNCGP